jgi:predicted RND superfamily exporter protein
MLKIAKKIVKFKVPILIISVLLLIPATLGFLNTRINYDILSYLPSDIDTMEGQEILKNDFGTGAFSMCIVENMDEKHVVELEEKIKKVDHVKNVVWYDSVADLSTPIDALPKDIKDAFINAKTGSTFFIVTFDTGSSDDETLNAITEIDKVTNKEVIQSGMSSVVADIKTICNTEAVAYVGIATLLSVIVLSVTMDSFLVPLFFLLSIGMAIIYNLGTCYFSGEISFITQALTAVLQLAVTLDYSIFLWHSYSEYKEKYPGDNDRAMAHAIAATFVSVVGSSITTVAGFVAMCFMTFTLGVDLGIVMAKGVILGVISCVTILPAMILIFDKAIEKTRHKPLMPDIGRMGKFVTNKYYIWMVMFLVILVPAIYGYTHTDVYYDLVGTLPSKYESVKGKEILAKDFEQGTTYMVLYDSDLSSVQGRKMLKEIENVKGMDVVAGLDNIKGAAVPDEVIPANIRKELDNGEYKLALLMSKYTVASDEVNDQINEIEGIVKEYDNSAMVIGEAPCTKDLIKITDTDFKRVSAVSIILIFIIILLVLRSVSLPVLLVTVIEFAIFINMGIPAYTNTTLPFIASIVIGTIQLGATVDYAILITNRYKKERRNGADKRNAVQTAMSTCLQSILVSAMSFFAATFGVGMYSSIDMISSICILLARGAIISFICVATVLPAMFMIFDKVIVKTSIGFKSKEKENMNKTHSGKVKSINA